MTWALFLFCFFLLVGAVWAEDRSSVNAAAAGPPMAKVEVVEDTFHGHTVSDSYRWLEDANSAETEGFVRQELAYTRGILDPLPGRARKKPNNCAWAMGWMRTRMWGR